MVPLMGGFENTGGDMFRQVLQVSLMTNIRSMMAPKKHGEIYVLRSILMATTLQELC